MSDRAKMMAEFVSWTQSDEALKLLHSLSSAEFEFAIWQASRAQADAEIADLRAVERMRDKEIADLRERHGGALCKLDEANAIISRQAEALDEFGEHKDGCASFTLLPTGFPNFNVCDCGLEEALSASTESVTAWKSEHAAKVLEEATKQGLGRLRAQSAQKKEG